MLQELIPSIKPQTSYRLSAAQDQKSPDLSTQAMALVSMNDCTCMLSGVIGKKNRLFNAFYISISSPPLPFSKMVFSSGRSLIQITWILLSSRNFNKCFEALFLPSPTARSTTCLTGVYEEPWSEELWGHREHHRSNTLKKKCKTNWVKHQLRNTGLNFQIWVKNATLLLRCYRGVCPDLREVKKAVPPESLPFLSHLSFFISERNPHLPPSTVCRYTQSLG